jgi:protein-S-isoprenylcysteine O-methyltransferase Ste14
LAATKAHGSYGFHGVGGRIGSVEWIAGVLLALGSLELQVRCVEEPCLLAKHGAQYRDYTVRVGRFMPGVGLTR